MFSELKAGETHFCILPQDILLGTQITSSQKLNQNWNSCCGAVEMNLTRNHKVPGLIPGFT